MTVTPRVPIAVTSANGGSGRWAAPVTLSRSGAPSAGVVPVKLATPGVGDSATIALTVVAALPMGLLSQVADVTARSSYDIERKPTRSR